MDRSGFKVSAEVLQRNAMKAEIRDLNAEFQMKGGKVIYKTSKKGDTYLLSHPDEEYLEKFRIRLLKELGLLEEKDIPKEVKEEPKSSAPRYGEKHSLRRGWNVRSPKEFGEGRYNPEDRRRPEGRSYDGDRERESYHDRGEYPDRGRGPPRQPRGGFDRPRGPGRDRYQDRPRRGPPSSEKFRPEPRKQEMDLDYEEQPDEGAKSFEERWDNIDQYVEIIKKALENGAVDDGEVIKYAYSADIDEEKIKTLKKMLWDNRCKGNRNKCPHGKKKFRFEDLMKVCSGKVEGFEKIDSPFKELLPLWEKNIEDMYGDIRGKRVEVKGKVSTYKPVTRKNHEHLKILVYDTVVIPEDTRKSKETRKLWVKIGMDEFRKLTKGMKIKVDDIIEFKGKCVYDNYFNDHWVVDIENIQIVEESDGKPLELPDN
jgi:hypothetical protein